MKSPFAWLVPAYEPELPGHAWHRGHLVGTSTAVCQQFQCPARHLERCHHERLCPACVDALRARGFGDAVLQRQKRKMRLRVACAVACLALLAIGRLYLELL